jgi:hypothetical protein
MVVYLLLKGTISVVPKTAGYEWGFTPEGNFLAR